MELMHWDLGHAGPQHISSTALLSNGSMSQLAELWPGSEPNTYKVWQCSRVF